MVNVKKDRGEFRSGMPTSFNLALYRTDTSEAGRYAGIFLNEG